MAAFLKTQEYFNFSEDLIKGQLGMVGHFCTNTYFHSEEVDRLLSFLAETGQHISCCSRQHTKMAEQDV